MKDVVIIGAGIAGLTAAIYCRRSGLDAVVLEKLAAGGQILNTPKIENYPGMADVSGFELASLLHEQAQKLGAQIDFDEVSAIAEKDGGFAILTGAGEEITCRTIIIANGARARKLEVPGEEEYASRGVSYCATCDGAFFKGRDVAVVGGGNTALEDALFLSNICRKVYLIHRRNSFRGDSASVESLLAKENVEPVLEAKVLKINGDKLVTSVTVQKNSGEQLELAVSGVFAAIGAVPQNEIFKEMVELDQYGYIIAGEDCKTSRKGIFAAGDTRTKALRQLVTAASDGAVAAGAAFEHIKG